MIISETDKRYEFEVYQSSCGDVGFSQGRDLIVIDKQQAAQLIEVLQRWVNGEEIE